MNSSCSHQGWKHNAHSWGSITPLYLLHDEELYWNLKYVGDKGTWHVLKLSIAACCNCPKKQFHPSGTTIGLAWKEISVRKWSLHNCHWNCSSLKHVGGMNKDGCKKGKTAVVYQDTWSCILCKFTQNPVPLCSVQSYLAVMSAERARSRMRWQEGMGGCNGEELETGRRADHTWKGGKFDGSGACQITSPFLGLICLHKITWTYWTIHLMQLWVDSLGCQKLIPGQGNK